MKDGMEGAAIIPATDIRRACELILASEMFINSPRASRLLRFLIEKAISGAVQDTSEYAIGIEVFDRNASTYNTSEDPIVRVQVGRLREKLKAYYMTLGINARLEISISMGDYMPVIRRRGAANNDFTHIPMFAIHPFRCIAHHGDGEPFTQGLQDELAHQLFKAFGKIIVAHSFFAHRETGNERRTIQNRTCVNHRLEGSIQIDTDLIRTSIRVVDASTGCITWSEQFNRNVSHAIAVQEELASSICGALKRFFNHE